MKILVTGGNGFLGAHVVNELNKYFKNVFILDLKKNNKNTKNKTIIADICNYESTQKALKGFDLVYHFAGLSDLDVAYKNPISTVKLNIEGTVNLLESCRINKVKKFIFASSMYVSGFHGSFYRCSKDSCEKYIKEYKERYNLNYLILRYGSLYGTGSDLSNGLYRIIHQILTDKQIRYTGDVESMREYINVIDAAKASVSILLKKYSNSSINITGQQSIKILDLLKIIKEIMNIKKPINIVYKKVLGHYKFFPHHYEEDISLKYTVNPYVDFGEGLKSFINYVSKNMK